MFGGEGRLNVAGWLGELRLGGSDWNLEVISPYFDGRGSAPLHGLIEALRPRETRVYLRGTRRDRRWSPKTVTEPQQNSKACDGLSCGRHDAAARPSSAASERLAPRRLHAKTYRLWNTDGKDVVLAGSANCTSAAHSHGAAGNLEAAFSDRYLPFGSAETVVA